MATTLEERFFGPGNRFQWPDIERNNLPQSVMTRLTPWIEDLQHKTETLLLPRASKTDPTKWYGMARNDRAFSVFRDEIVAFIGATYSDYSLASCRLNDADPIDAALMQEFGRNLFVFTVSGDHQNIVHERLLLHRRLSLERPKRQEVSYRPTGRILGEFDEAIRQNDVDSAQEYYDELKNSGRIDSINLIGLHVLLCEIKEDWESILDDPQIDDLLQRRRPQRVTIALLRAVYARELLAFEIDDDRDQAVERFRTVVLPNYRSILSSRTGLAGKEVDILFVLKAISMDPPNLDQRDTILGLKQRSSQEQIWIEKVAGVALPTGDRDQSALSEAQVIQQAHEALTNLDADLAWDLTEKVSLSLDTLRIKLRCAHAVQNLDYAKIALVSFDQTSKDRQTQIVANVKFKEIIDQLRTLTVPIALDGVTDLDIPDNWLSWVLSLGSEAGRANAMELATAGRYEWDATVFSSDRSAAAELASAIDNLDDAGGQVFRDCLAQFLHAFDEVEEDTHNLGVVFSAVMTRVLLFDEKGKLYLRLVTDVISRCLDTGISKQNYKSMLGDYRDAILAQASRNQIDFMIDAVDILMEHPAPDPEVRVSTIIGVTNYLIRNLDLLNFHQTSVINDIFRDLGHDAPQEIIDRIVDPKNEGTDQGQTIYAALKGKTVSIYSLKVSVLSRVEKFLDELGIGVTVKTFSDKKGGSASLKHAAVDSDIFIIATAAATHSTTNFIENNRRKGETTLKPLGQGSSSMLACLREFVIQ